MEIDRDIIKQLIEDAGMTKVQFAKACGLSYVYALQCLSGKREMSGKTLCNVAKLFNVDVADLYTEREPQPSEIPEGETYIQCPHCKQLVAISMKTARIKDPEDLLSKA